MTPKVAPRFLRIRSPRLHTLLDARFRLNVIGATGAPLQPGRPPLIVD
jgi:hypothetical protein